MRFVDVIASKVSDDIARSPIGNHIKFSYIIINLSQNLDTEIAIDGTNLLNPCLVKIIRILDLS